MNRAQRFTYRGYQSNGSTITATYELDGLVFHERVSVPDADLADPAVDAIIELWYLIAGLSYYKTGAPLIVDFAGHQVGEHGMALVRAAYIDGLGEFAYRNGLNLDDITFTGDSPLRAPVVAPASESVLIPFGGGIDSCVTVDALSHLPRTLFVMSPAHATFAPLEEAAAVTGLPVARVTRQLDLEALRSHSRFNGHVPVTAMVTLLACVRALSDGHGAVVMSNEHSSSVPNVVTNGRAINHQWSKSAEAELLIANAVAERVGNGFTVASFLRDRSELWVAREFSTLTHFHPLFRSCNRAFTQEQATRAVTWCGSCDKCLFINLVLAPFMDRAVLSAIFESEPLANPTLWGQLETLVGRGVNDKPFECVGDPSECAAALIAVAAHSQWSDVSAIHQLAAELPTEPTLRALLEPQGVSRVPTSWLR